MLKATTKEKSMADTLTTTAIRAYFQAKRKELMALAELPICKHPSLIGSHREQIYRTYLSDLLPRRYSVGRGMVYEMVGRSKEADIVIWDSNNFPSLPLLDHSFFFAESVKAVVECKSSWSAENFDDVLEKCGAVDDLVPTKSPTLEDAVAMLQDRVTAIEHGRSIQGALLAKHQIGTVAMFLTGGTKLTPKKLMGLRSTDMEIDRGWPDLLLFLETGQLIIKDRSCEEAPQGLLKFFNFGDNALLAFSIELLRIIEDRVVHSDARFYMDKYACQILEWHPQYVRKFRMRRLPAGRQVFWSDPAED